ncbi:MAG: hypothetical protein WC657_09175 [Candidatus Paceibacterota bacterium]|jgi:hypothetical protein
MNVISTWHGESFKRHVHNNAENFLKDIGFQIERRTKENMASIYDRPQRGRYVRTGAARASVHSIFEASEMAVYIGSNQEELNNERIKAGFTGSGVFYFIWLEEGFTSRAGRFIAGHHMLKNALDVVKAKYR